jgi:uncharacterized protein YdhG (YjbR/CyaY superfamily)
MARPAFQTVAAYIAAQPDRAQPALERVRAIVRKALPSAEETISYGVPTYKRHGTYVVYFAGFKEHYSLYPVTDRIAAAFKGDLSPYRVSTGTLRFAYTDPVPVKLIQGVVKVLAAAAAERADARAGGRKPARKNPAPKTAARKKTARRKTAAR